MNKTASPAGAKIDFRSDNVATVSPEIMAAMLAANSGTEAPYGEDFYSRLLDARLVTICRKLGKGFDEGA